MKKRVWLVLLCIFGFLAGCGQQAQDNQNEGLDIVTSFYPMYAITKEVSGDLNNVRMIQSGNGIHGYEPSASDIRAINDSDVFIYHSGNLESWAGDLKSNLEGTDVHVIEGSANLELKRTQGLEDVEASNGMDASSLNDVHTWTDPEMAGEEALTIAEQLGEVDPDNADTYMQNAKDFKAEADKIVSDYQPKFDALDQKTFVTQHTAFAYLADRFGLTQLGIAGQENQSEPSAQRISEIQDFVKEYKVKTIFTEENVSPKYAQVISDSTGVDMVELSPLEVDPKNDKSYLENLEANIEILYENLVSDSQES